MTKPRAVTVELSVQLNPGSLTWPSDEDARESEEFEGAAMNRSFVDLSGADWNDVRHVLELEGELLQALRADAEPDAILIDFEPDEMEDDDVAPSTDFGTSAAVLALNAAGCPTITSCSGHVEGYPYIAFWARPSHVPALIEAATEASVGIGNAEQGAAEVFTNAEDLDGLLRFARALEKRAAAFHALRHSLR